ncbi:MAG: hypothetical protein LC804_24715 [Acidobacteria bacterium]|nr:hypothetical protein [Acidobacteriota bacterium]
MKKQPDEGGLIPPVVAAGIFSGLSLGVREVDFIGWFREERVVGAILTQGAHPLAPDIWRRIGQRITETLRGCVPSDVAGRLQVRVLQLRPPQSSSAT